MEWFIGTSGYSYPKWKGSFYPADLVAAKMLSFYATKFSSVEINNTFYRMPSAKLIDGWAHETGGNFSFAIKAPQRITHQLRLKDAADPTEVLFKIIGGLGEKLGPVLFQLPPFMKKDIERLNDFLALLPPSVRVTFEFRHASWFDDEVYSALRARNVALCIADAEKMTTPFVATADFGYLRLRQPEYDAKAIADWKDQIAAQKWGRVYVFFKHEDEGRGPAFATQLSSML